MKINYIYFHFARFSMTIVIIAISLNFEVIFARKLKKY